MSTNTSTVESTSTISPLDRRIDAQSASDHGSTAKTSKYDSALNRLFTTMTNRQREFLKKKETLDESTKEFSALRIKPTQVLQITDMPITVEAIETADAALKGGGMNVKGFQRALEIYDVAELNRTRKGLVLAGVTLETENYRGTNATWIELHPDFVAGDQEQAEQEVQAEETEPKAEAEPEVVKPIKPAARR